MARVDNPGDDLEAAFKSAWIRHAAIQEQVSGMTAEAGRLLQSFRMVADSRDARTASALGDVLGGSGRMKDVAEKLVELEKVGVGPGGINQFALRSLLPRWRDKAVELYINSLLSGPQTHAVNILSNTLTALAQVPEHAVAAGVGAIRRAIPNQRKTDAVLFSELGARATGLLQGTREGMREAARSFVTGHSSDPITKVETEQMHAIGGKLGSVIRTPTRLLSAEDELFKGIARRMELSGLAVRKARSEGLKGDAAKARAAELASNPSDGMLQRAMDYGRYVTFQRPLPTDSFAAGVSRGTQRHPIAKLLLPFIRTPVNLLSFAAERSPIAPMMRQWRKEVAAGGASRDLALARMMVGTGFGAAMYEMALAGKITGGGPADDNARRLMLADGWQPYSLKVGDRYYSYTRLDPFSTTIGTVADIADMGEHMTDKQREHSAMLVAAAVVNNLSSKTWLSGLSAGLEAVNDPDRYLQSFLSRTAGGIAVPNVVAQMARVNDPILREARGPIDRIRSRIPGLSSSLPPALDVFGKPITAEGGLGPDIISPIWTSTARRDPVVNDMIANGVTLGQPSRGDMSAIDYNRYRAAAGPAVRNAMLEATTTPAWAQGDADTRQEIAHRVIAKARRGVKGGKTRGRRGPNIPPPPPGFVVQP
ncbi:hypothetical protein [Sphingomonas oligophenolica]|nr:hypothetical protein [Sphingomonas oligophenolica]